MKLRYGVVGGGNGGFIGSVHRRAAGFDYLADLVAGAFSRKREASLAAAEKWGVDKERVYESYEAMAEAESARGDGIDFVCIATPNYTHFDVAKTFLSRGIHVVCDKPMTLTVEQAEELAQLVEETGLLFGVTYTYSGYPILLQAREIIQSGALGQIHMLKARYEEDYLAAWDTDIANEPSERTDWYKDPQKNGKTGCTAGIGTHAEYLLRFLTGVAPKRLLARFEYTIPASPIETGVNAMLEYEGGVRGMIWATNTAVGHHNDVAVEIQCEKGTISWDQYHATQLFVDRIGGPREIYDAGRPYLGEAVKDCCRLPAGHPEGFYEAFSNVYRRFCQDLIKKKEGQTLAAYQFPTVRDGLLGMRFIEACYNSHHAGSVWTEI